LPDGDLFVDLCNTKSVAEETIADNIARDDAKGFES
jgi:hypothetical protein